MDICNTEHEPTYKITYRGAKNSPHKPEWLVCENCHEKKIFGNTDDIISLEKIN